MKTFPFAINSEFISYLIKLALGGIFFPIGGGGCSLAQSCPALCNSMECSTPDFPFLHHLLEFAQTHIH